MEDAFIKCDKPGSSKGVDQAEIYECEVGLAPLCFVTFSVRTFLYISPTLERFPGDPGEAGHQAPSRHK